MKRNTLLAAMTLAATALGGAAFADSNHGHGGQPGAKSGPGMMQSGGPDMMGMMGKLKETQKKVEATKKRLDTVMVDETSNNIHFNAELSVNPPIWVRCSVS